jgi:signal transduction histidine kinase
VRLSSNFLAAYRIERRPAARLEYVLAVGRAFLAVSGFFAIRLDPTEPQRLASITYGVLIVYAIYSLAVLALLRAAPGVRPGHVRLLHGLDILFTSALTFASNGPISPFFLFFLYVVLSAAFRWGFTETMATAALTLTLFVMQWRLAVDGPWREVLLSDTVFELNRTILRIAYLLMTGALLGYLAEQEKRFRAEMAATAEAMQQPRVELGLGGSIVALSRMLLRVFDAEAADFIIQERDGRTLLWHVGPDGGQEIVTAADPVELDPIEQERWLFAAAPAMWHALAGADGEPLRVRTLQRDAWALGSETVQLPRGVPPRPFQSLIVSSLGLDGEWRGRLYLYNGDSRELEHRLHFLDSLVSHVTPALTNVVLLRRLGSQAGAAERARVARDLHDGTIQALIGVEMKVQALRRAAEREHSTMAAELASVQDLLRAEVLAVREVMQALRPVELDAVHQLPDVLASVVERFRRDSGVSARFVSKVSSIQLTPTVAIEVVRIVQEALANVRKHSRALNVLVRFTQTADGYTLVVEDDGRGFDFEGLLTHEELDRARIGPAIIKERARLIGGHVTIESTPRVGARIQVTFGAPVHV